MPSDNTEPWSSIGEVATHLGVRKDSIYRWIEKRGLPARKIGKRWARDWVLQGSSKRVQWISQRLSAMRLQHAIVV